MKFLLDVISSTAMLEPLDEGAITTCFSYLAISWRSHPPVAFTHLPLVPGRWSDCLYFHLITDKARAGGTDNLGPSSCVQPKTETTGRGRSTCMVYLIPKPFVTDG
ncbi:unnamed protein product [Ectocarpus sp. 12 AP-2014]